MQTVRGEVGVGKNTTESLAAARTPGPKVHDSPCLADGNAMPTQDSIAPSRSLPLSPDIESQSSSRPAIECLQLALRLAPAVVTSPPAQVARQVSDYQWQVPPPLG